MARVCSDADPCGPSSWRLPRWLPGLWQFVFKSECRDHDAAYTRGGTATDRLNADRAFAASCMGAARAHVWYRRLYLIPVAWLYGRLVRLRGWRYFRYTA